MSAYKKVLIPLDLSEASDQVAVAARDLAAYSNAALVILHVVEFVPVSPLGDPLMPTIQVEDDLVKLAKQKLAGLIARLSLAQASCRVEPGITKAQILRVAAEEKVDLIVMGSRERHGMAILVNFTEDTVLHGAPCDVLAIRVKS
jgi:universal stress protein A